MYALGIGAVASGRVGVPRPVARYLCEPADVGPRPIYCLGGFDIWTCSISIGDISLPGKRLHHTPFNDHLHEVLRESCNQLMINDEEYTFAFDELEILVGLSVGHSQPEGRGWFPVGSFLHRGETRQRVLREIKNSLETSGDQSQFVRCGIFGSTAAACLETFQSFEHFVARVATQRGIWTPVY